jgi:hypothetical protein
VAVWLYGVVPFLIAFGVVSAAFGIARARDRRRAFKISVASFVLAGLAFLLSVIIGSSSAMPT